MSKTITLTSALQKNKINAERLEKVLATYTSLNYDHTPDVQFSVVLNVFKTSWRVTSEPLPNAIHVGITSARGNSDCATVALRLLFQAGLEPDGKPQVKADEPVAETALVVTPEPVAAEPDLAAFLPSLENVEPATEEVMEADFAEWKLNRAAGTEADAAQAVAQLGTPTLTAECLAAGTDWPSKAETDAIQAAQEPAAPAPAVAAPATAPTQTNGHTLPGRMVNILKQLINAPTPLTREDLSALTGITKGWSKLLGASTKGDGGVAGDTSLTGRGLVHCSQVEGQRALLYTITAKGKAALEAAQMAADGTTHFAD